MGKNSRNGIWLITICSFLVLLLICRIGSADSNTRNVPDDPNDPKELLRKKWSDVVSILQKEDMEETVKEKKISKIVTPIFDFPLMAKLSLGRKHWPKFDTEQQEKFTRLFSERLKRSYWKKIALYKDEKILFKDKEKKENIYLIPMELLYKDKKVDILYKIRRNEKSWKIYDVEIQGVSILLTYRSQFDEILSHGTVKDLLSRLEKQPDD
ncbi:MAG: ABC transporter substrate-binding protein [Sedimentisphaerales bacterium]|nr:ABC transporter substrate-binding protein [Sedimentisphaerales bacterium]